MNEDELFYIIEGSLLMEIECNEDFIMGKGDFYVVKKGINHRVSSKEECLIMLIESKLPNILVLLHLLGHLVKGNIEKSLTW
ncbi:MAG: cupin domain-containing protein [Flavobacteriaceae bacterium]